ncbi:MAG: 50S ribosomal protein L4 [Anaerolineaceae bacterium]|nr:50S ribosomal protein L4 [Anaerolineaceae bacterium]
MSETRLPVREVPLHNMQGEEIGSQELPAAIFAARVNVGLMHQAYVRQMAGARRGTHSTKKRSEIRATGAKAWRQKGTGRARHGPRSAPIFVGGGVAFGPKPRSHRKGMPRKMRRAAIRSALSAITRDEQLLLVDEFAVADGKTSTMAAALRQLVGEQSTLIILPAADENVARGLRNLPKVRYVRAEYLNIRDLLNYERVVLPIAALETIQRIWG